MLKIDYLRLHLPAGYEKQASSIARLVAKELGGLPVEHAARIEHLTVPQIKIQGERTDKELAAGIARSIHRQVQGGGKHE